MLYAINTVLRYANSVLTVTLVSTVKAPQRIAMTFSSSGSHISQTKYRSKFLGYEKCNSAPLSFHAKLSLYSQRRLSDFS